MTTKLSDLIAELSAADQKDVADRKGAHLRAMADARRLPELRQGAGVRQVDVAQAMRVGQNAVSQMESRNDWQLSTLSRYMEGFGYRLELALVDTSGDRMLLPNFRPWEAVAMAVEPEKQPAKARASVPHKRSPAKKAPGRESAVAAKSGASAAKKR